MKLLIACAALVIAASQPVLAQQVSSEQQILKAEAESALMQIQELQRQLVWAEIKGASFLALAATTGLSGYLSIKLTKFGFGVVEKVIPDDGDIIPGKHRAPWMIRVAVKGADKSVRLIKKVVPLLTAVPTLTATTGALVFTLIEAKNIFQLSTVLAEARAEYETAYGSLQ